MAIVINGSGTVTGLAVGGLPDGTVDDGTVASGIASSKLTGALPAISGASLTSVNAVNGGRKNLIINGAMQVSQRGSYSSATSVANGTYYLDRWRAALNAVAGTITHSTEVVSSVTFESLLLTATSSATGHLAVTQPIEFPTSYRGVELTISAKVKSNSSNARISFWGGSGGTLGNSTAHTGGGAVETLSATFTVPSNATLMDGYIGLISTGTGNLAISSGDYAEIFDVQVERGSVATDFEHRSYGEELALCQRYFYQDIKGNTQEVGVGWYYNSGAISWIVNFPVPMRASPSMDYSGPTNGWTIYRNNAPDSFTTLVMENVNHQYTRASMFNNTQVSGTAGWAGIVRATNSNCLLSFSAEL